MTWDKLRQLGKIWKNLTKTWKNLENNLTVRKYLNIKPTWETHSQSKLVFHLVLCYKRQMQWVGPWVLFRHGSGVKKRYFSFQNAFWPKYILGKILRWAKWGKCSQLFRTFLVGTYSSPIIEWEKIIFINKIEIFL